MIPTHIGHIHLSDLDEPVFHGFGQLFVNQRIHRTCTSHFWIDFYSSIILTIDALFESGQVLDIYEVFGEEFVSIVWFKMQRGRRLVDLCYE